MNRGNFGKQIAAKGKVSIPEPRSRALRPGGMAKGGKVHDDEAMDRKLIREELGKRGMKCGGKVRK